jgi:hypothetical protein
MCHRQGLGLWREDSSGEFVRQVLFGFALGLTSWLLSVCVVWLAGGFQ